MELKRKQKRVVVHGDYCVLNKDSLIKSINTGKKKQSIYHQKHPILNIFEVERFIVSMLSIWIL